MASKLAEIIAALANVVVTHLNAREPVQPVQDDLASKTKTIRIQKRDGSFEEFNAAKIKRAVVLAHFDVLHKTPTTTDLEKIISAVKDSVSWADEPILAVGEVHRLVEAALAALGEEGERVSVGYREFRERRDHARELRLRPDTQAIADYIHIAKYSRYRDDLGRREVYSETVDRVKEMHLRKFLHLGEEFARQIEEAFGFVYRKEVLPSMRSMQFGGAAIEKHNARSYNCSFGPIDRPRAFAEALYLLLCGCGVGYSVQWRHVDQLPPIAKQTRQVVYHTIEDTIEGWADAVDALINGALAGVYVEFNYSLIRPEGTPLKTSGGLAPGHLGLKASLENVRKILLGAQERKLRPIECHDILCFLADAVLSGGIRRSSLISLFSADDSEMMYAKARGNFEPWPGGKNEQRQMANNSVALLKDENDRRIFDRVIKIADENFGDPGFVFVKTPDWGVNPCSEISLFPYILDPVTNKQLSGWCFCNLDEDNIATVRDEEDFLARCRASAFIGTLQASYTNFEYLGWVTEEITRRDALLGCGMTGIMDNPAIGLNPELLERGAKLVLEENERVAKIIGINPAQRATTVKPSGTTSLELGCVGSGIHPHHARRYFRRVTANINEPPAQYFMSVNPHMVEKVPSKPTDVKLVFPIQAPDCAETVKTMTTEKFLQSVITVYQHWVKPGCRDGVAHSVSATATIRDGERQQVLDFIWENRNSISAMSFVPFSIDKAFAFAPREEVLPQDEGRWNNLIQNYRPVDWTKFREKSDATALRGEQACVSGSCEVT
jgi:ribonucleoside-triphosphate reductase